jgi:hypothetical protein
MTRCACLVSVVLALLLAGCKGQSYRIAPVSGRVMLDNKPLPKASVQFVPVDKGLPGSAGLTDADGRYSLSLTSGSQEEGAVVGKHKVVILLGAQGGSDGGTKPILHKQLPQRYNRKTELECDVPADGRDNANFDLKSDPKAN